MNRSKAFAFVAGGTVQAGGGVYLERLADRELVERCRAGDFTYILTSRQMGKSSLMIRTAERLAEEGALPVIIDLTEFGAQTTAEQWYKGFLFGVQDQLGLRTPAAAWWDTQSEHSYALRFTRYLREVALVERTARVVIFVDEIDTTLRLDFTDDFFAAIRFLYQHRAADPVLERLSFVLIGVATPGDLIKDTARTPFNIGHGIELTDFTFDEASTLASHLALPDSTGRDLIGWILRWTGGHPYLTLRVVRSFAEAPPPEWTDAAVDDRIQSLFLHEGADTDSNLQFVRDMLTKKAFDREAVLRTYERVRRGERVPDTEQDQVTSWLKLSGVVGREQGALRVRNAIYEQVFDERWTRDHLRLNVNWRRRLTRVASVLLVLTVLVTIPLAIYAWRQKNEAQYQAHEAQIERDQATRLRAVAENSLSERTAALESMQELLVALQRADPKNAPEIAAQVEQARKEAQREYDGVIDKLRTERDEAVRKLGTAGTRPSTARPDVTQAAGDPRRVTPAPPARPNQDQVDLVRLIRQYEFAYAARSVDAVQRVQVLSPAEAKALRAAFADALAYRITLDKLDINVSPDRRQATVTAQMSQEITTRSRRRTSTSVPVFSLEKRGASWMIVAVR
jgi:AAA-like domain